jgi:hypothetical protein
MPPPAPDFLAVLRDLVAHRVEFIIVGGVGAALQGAPVSTFDLDIVHSRAPENIHRLLAALQAMDAWYREHPAKRLKPSAADLAGAGRHLLMTRAGPLDVLGVVTGGRGYAELIPNAVELLAEPGLPIKVLDLTGLIALKEELGREKDVATLPVLRRTLQERDRLR